MLNYIKTCKVISTFLIIIAVTIGITTVSTIDYEEEARLPIEERMTSEELKMRILLIGAFGVVGLLFNYAANENEKYFEYIIEENEQ